jgi:hypothetical protein
MFISFDTAHLGRSSSTSEHADHRHQIHHKDRVVSTQPRVLILDNISAIEQFTPTVTPTSPHLFKPAIAMHAREPESARAHRTTSRRRSRRPVT